MSESVDELLVRYSNGDDSVFGPLYVAASPGLLKYLVKLTRNRELSEDLMQQVFLKVHLARADYRPQSKAMVWMCMIGKYLFLDGYRRSKIEAAYVERQQELHHADITGMIPVETLDATLVAAANAAVMKLPSAQREAILLTSGGGMTSVQAANVLGTKDVTVRARVHRGMKKVRATMGVQ